MQQSYKTATGGTVTYTKTGLIHTAGKQYSGAIAQAEAKKPAKAKG